MKQIGVRACHFLQPRSELPAPGSPNHQSLHRPRGPHIELPRFLALVFALGWHAPGARQRHHRELQPFAGVHGQHLDGVGGRVEAARAFAHLVRQAALAQHAGAFVHLPVVPADDGHVPPGVA